METSEQRAAAPFRIAFATAAEDIAAVAELFREYTAGLGIDLSYQSFAQEVAGLPGKYSPPHGVLLIARTCTNGADDRDGCGNPVGCVAVRPLPADESAGAARCELKRLYLRPEARGTGLAVALARKAMSEAAALGYSDMVLDTLPSMTAAQSLYARLGFVEIPAYYESPIVGTSFLSVSLGPSGSQ